MPLFFFLHLYRIIKLHYNKQQYMIKNIIYKQITIDTHTFHSPYKNTESEDNCCLTIFYNQVPVTYIIK